MYKMASFNVMCFEIKDKDTKEKLFIEVLEKYHKEKNKYSYGNNASRIEEFEIQTIKNKEVVIIFLNKFLLAKESKYNLYTQTDDDFKKEDLTKNQFLGACNIALYCKNSGLLFYQSNQNATSYKTFFNLINTNNIIDSIIEFGIKLDESINKITKIKKIKFSFSDEYNFSSEDNCVNTMQKELDNFEGGNIKVEISAKKNSFLNEAFSKKFIQNNKSLDSLTAEYKNDENKKLFYDLITSILSYKDEMDNDKQKDFNECKKKILDIYQTLINKI